MARRNAVPLGRAWTPEKVRQRIRTSMIVRRLTNHFLGKLEMTQTQMTAGLALLRKTLPDLTAIEHSGTLLTRRADELSDADLTDIALRGRSGDAEQAPSQAGNGGVH